MPKASKKSVALKALKEAGLSEEEAKELSGVMSAAFSLVPKITSTTKCVFDNSNFVCKSKVKLGGRIAGEETTSVPKEHAGDLIKSIGKPAIKKTFEDLNVDFDV